VTGAAREARAPAGDRRAPGRGHTPGGPPAVPDRRARLACSWARSGWRAERSRRIS